jgi:hypothetical protein
MHDLINHLWQSTAFALAAALLTFTLRGHNARARYWLWFAASIKFLLPFSILVDAEAGWNSPPRRTRSRRSPLSASRLHSRPCR